MKVLSFGIDCWGQQGCSWEIPAKTARCGDLTLRRQRALHLRGSQLQVRCNLDVCPEVMSRNQRIVQKGVSNFDPS